MKQLLLSLCLLFGTVLSAQTIGDCNSTTAIPIDDLLTAVENDLPYSLGTNSTYCISSAIPFFTGDLGVISLSSPIAAYPFSVSVTDLTTSTTTTLSAQGDMTTIIIGRLYFVEIVPSAAGSADITLTPSAALQLLGAVPEIVSVTVVDPLPVTWMAPLSWSNKGKVNEFSWSVSNQENVEGYYLEADRGNGFAPVTFVASDDAMAGEVRYEATDLVRTEDAYYRIRQTDLDGSFSFSNLIMVEGSELSKEISVFPNPVSDQVNFSSPVAIDLARLLDISGKELRTVVGAGPTGTVSVDGLQPGLYLLELFGANGDRTVRRVSVR